MNRNDLYALLKLLDDRDNEVFKIVRNKLLQSGEEYIPEMLAFAQNSRNVLLQKRTEEIVSKIQQTKIDTEFKNWLKNDQNLLYGAFLVAKYPYPDIEFSDIENKLNKIIAGLRAEINIYLTGLQQIRKINHILYEIHRFGPDFSDFLNPDASFLNRALENKKSNDVLIAIVYLHIAQKLALPVYGVDFPGNFLLMFKDERLGEALFYINPFNKGAVITKNDINTFLKNHKLQAKKRYFEPCSNKVIIKRLLHFLLNSYIKKNNKQKTEEIKRILNFF